MSKFKNAIDPYYRAYFITTQASKPFLRFTSLLTSINCLACQATIIIVVTIIIFVITIIAANLLQLSLSCMNLNLFL